MKKWTLERPFPTHVDSPEKIRKIKEKIARTRTAAIDTETDGLDISKRRPRFWSLATDLNSRYFLEDSLLPEFETIFNDPTIDWIGTHTKFDAHMLQNAGMPIKGNLFCTLVMDRLLDPNSEHGLKECYEREFGEKMKTFAETFYPRSPKTGKPQAPKNKNLITILEETWQTDPSKVVEYASLDAWASLRLFKKLSAALQKITTGTGNTLWDIYLDYELPFTRVLLECESNGVLIDAPYLQSLEPKILEEQELVNRKLNKAAGQPVNPNSPKQLQELFFKKMGLKPLEWTSGGASGNKKPSASESVLIKYAEKGVEEAVFVLRYRKLTKILGTYVRGVLDRLDENNRLHGTLNQHVTDTARLSGTDPNLQNIPRPASDEFKIRRAFIAPKGKKFLSVDYAQLEMYLMGHMSKDAGMISNIKGGLDIHAGNASLVWDVPYKEILEAKKAQEEKHKLTSRQELLLEHRQFAKVVGFGLNYGKQKRLLAIELGLHKKVADDVRSRMKKSHPFANERHIQNVIDRKAQDEAQKIIDRYFDRIPGVKQFIQVTHHLAARRKFVESIIGRRRWLPAIMDREEQLEHEREAWRKYKKACWCPRCRDSRAAERRSVNTIIQGSAADVTMMGMIKCSQDTDLVSCRMLFPVHDEVNFEVPEEIAEEAAARIQYWMENPGVTLRVPLKAEPQMGSNWAEAH